MAKKKKKKNRAAGSGRSSAAATNELQLHGRGAGRKMLGRMRGGSVRGEMRRARAARLLDARGETRRAKGRRAASRYKPFRGMRACFGRMPRIKNLWFDRLALDRNERLQEAAAGANRGELDLLRPGETNRFVSKLFHAKMHLMAAQFHIADLEVNANCWENTKAKLRQMIDQRTEEGGSLFQLLSHQ